MNNEHIHDKPDADEGYFNDEKEVEQYSDSLIEAIQGGATLKDVNAVSNETMNDVYKLAYDFYHHGKLNDAESLFRFLCIYFMNFAFGAIFFVSDGVKILLESMIESYKVFPRGEDLLNFNWQELGYFLMVIAKSSIMLAAPVLIIMMIAEVLLGVFARYCPQLNPFSLSLTVKSFIAFIVFLLYGFTAMFEKTLQIFPMVALKNFIS